MSLPVAGALAPSTLIDWFLWRWCEVTVERVDRDSIHEEMERARAQFHRILDAASADGLRQGTRATRWNNQQLLFHMLFGYMIVRTLLPLVRTMGRVPDWMSKAFAKALNAGTRPFHVINYLGSCGGATVFRGERMAARLDRTIDSLHRHLDAEHESALGRGMHFPVDWDPYFGEVMTLADVYHYGSQHFEHHRRQLTIGTR